MVTPVLLSGGVGSRLWPVSREAYPKQFLATGEVNIESLPGRSKIKLTNKVFDGIGVL